MVCWTAWGIISYSLPLLFRYPYYSSIYAISKMLLFLPGRRIVMLRLPLIRTFRFAFALCVAAPAMLSIMGQTQPTYAQT